MTGLAGDSTAAADACERLLAAFLEQDGAEPRDPEELFRAHPEHAPTLRRWWQQYLAMAGRRAAAPAGDRFGPFVLQRQLGVGAQGAVHLAVDTRLGRQVALKILPLHRAVRDEALARFRREAEVASRLDHPGICTVYEAGEFDGAAYIAMRHIEGETLAETLAAARAAGRSLPLEFALGLAEQAALAMHAAHEAGLVHRDIKPGNIMVTPAGKPVLLDFGLARDAQDASELTHTGDLLGTPAYMSPEQLHAGRFTVDGRADVWALGITLYECLTLRRPFEAPTQEKLMQLVLTAPVPDPRQWRPELAREAVVVLRTALAKDREHRYATAGHFAEDLRRLRGAEAVLARPPGPWRRAWSWCRQQPALAASLALLVLSLGAGAIASLLLWLEADAAYSAYVPLADLERLRTAEARARDLHPAAPALAPALRAWLELQGRPLAERLPLHRRALLELRERALPRSPDDDERDRGAHPAAARIRELYERREAEERAVDPTRPEPARIMRQERVHRIDEQIAALEREIERHRGCTFADSETAFLHNQLAQLVVDLEQFAAPGGTLAAIEDRLRWAERVVPSTVGGPASAWQAASDAIAADPRFGGRRLPPQIGLVPLGADPRSRLQEFAFLRGGAVPVRDQVTQELQLDVASAPVLVLAPPGTFLMGAQRRAEEPNHDPDARAEEGPPFAAEVDWLFVGKHELTRGQWRRLGGDDRPVLADEVLGVDADLHPMADVSWWRVTEVLGWHELVLPTQAQWEYAARAGTSTVFWTGNDAASLAGAANFREPEGDVWVLTAPVHVGRANAFGLTFTAGNVAEWCRGLTRGNYRDTETGVGDGEALAPTIKSRPVRGGSFVRATGSGRSAGRGVRNCDTRLTDVGVRAVRSVRD